MEKNIHHYQGELELITKERHIQDALFATVHTLIRTSSSETLVATKKETKTLELDLFPEIQQLF